MNFTGATRGIRKMMHQSAQEDAVEALICKRQMLDVALKKLDVGEFVARQGDELWTEVNANRAIALPAQKVSKDARAAAQIGNVRTRLQPSQSHARRQQPKAGFRREDIIVVAGGMG